MIVEKLELKNFRNYENLSIDFSDNVNIIYGDNAQGKTNIIEGIYLCSTTRSHKGSKDRDMIKIGSDAANLKMYLKKDTFNYKFEIILNKNAKKNIFINGTPIKRAADLYGIANIVLFSPEDLNMIKNGPAERRKFMDAELCQINRLYFKYLAKYNKILDERNELLKKMNGDANAEDTLFVWDRQLIEAGSFIIKERENFINELNEIILGIHEQISGGKENLVIKYVPNVSYDGFSETLKKNLGKDLYNKTTSVGPHRDDIEFYIKDKNVRVYGSQGQQRTVALSLKLSEIELVKRKIGENPILLLDDVLSELDRTRQQSLLNFIEGIQTIITCTGLEEFVGYRINQNTLFKVKNGEIEKI